MEIDIISLFLLYAMGHTTGILTFMFIVWAAEKTGHKRDFYYNKGDKE